VREEAEEETQLVSRPALSILSSADSRHRTLIWLKPRKSNVSGFPSLLCLRCFRQTARTRSGVSSRYNSSPN